MNFWETWVKILYYNIHKNKIFLNKQNAYATYNLAIVSYYKNDSNPCI